MSSARFARFIAVGVLNTAVGYSLFALFYLALANHQLAIVLATVLGVLFNFFSTGRLVFYSRTPRALLPFIGGYMVTCTANLALLEILVAGGVRPLVGQLIVLPLIVVLSFAINSRLVFRDSPRTT